MSFCYYHLMAQKSKHLNTIHWLLHVTKQAPLHTVYNFIKTLGVNLN